MEEEVAPETERRGAIFSAGSFRQIKATRRRKLEARPRVGARPSTDEPKTAGMTGILPGESRFRCWRPQGCCGPGCFGARHPFVSPGKGRTRTFLALVISGCGGAKTGGRAGPPRPSLRLLLKPAKETTNNSANSSNATPASAASSKPAGRRSRSVVPPFAAGIHGKKAMLSWYGIPFNGRPLVERRNLRYV